MKLGANMQSWNVYLRGKLINTVEYTLDCDAAYVKQSLINHDGFDPSIIVMKR
jgi:hypothetical protein